MIRYVIRRGNGEFWVAPGFWSLEFPDACLFDCWREAAWEALASEQTPVDSVRVIGDYGGCEEQTVLVLSRPTFEEVGQ